ncbi:MAG TPA: type VI secretion system baseplate subunit TssG [Gammaproteobacteria bacterium]|nr:type VI secretion system baseplate subunit TssG [Gammaproteobacteria bacterium]
MATETRQTTADLESELIANGREYDFFQAVRLLQRLPNAAGGTRFRPVLSLERGEADIASVRHREDGGYEISPTFMALYGVSSPLPVWYTAELLEDEWNEQHATRDMLDMVHQQIYPLLYEAWRKYRFALNAIEGHADPYWGMLFAFMGLYEPQVRARAPDAARLLRYASLFSRQVRSAAALETMLRGALGGPEVEVVQCVKRQAAIPADQRASIGHRACTLGEDAVLGERIEDRCGKFQIRIGPVDAETFNAALRDDGLVARVKRVCAYFLVQPLECELVLILAPEVAQPATLGGSDWSRLMGFNEFATLGQDVWLMNGSNESELEISLTLQ